MKTRFAPSPTGIIHMGNARTALFSALMAQKDGGHFVLRIEDTDKERSQQQYVDALIEDLHWLGIQWQEGPDVGGEHTPYTQSQREDLYESLYQRLIESGHVYPCFCSGAQLEVMRKSQAQAGLPPRYDGRCGVLAAEQVAKNKAAGIPYTLRFKVPKGREVVFQDLIKGRQRFKTDDIGDFIIKKADGSASFFFSNAIDDSLMGITHVFRGEDHISNTPRQILLLEALGMTLPHYGHLNMIMGSDGAPLSKRNGSRSIQDLRDNHFFPQAVVNYMARLGHSYESNDFMIYDQLCEHFRMDRLGTSPARYDETQLHHWQEEYLQQVDADILWHWLDDDVNTLVPADKREAFVETIRPNITQPQDGVVWAKNFFQSQSFDLSDFADITDTLDATFAHAAVEAVDQQMDWKALTNHVKQATGLKGKGLFQPLRLAMIGQLHGPEMAKIYDLVPADELKRRFQALLA